MEPSPVLHKHAQESLAHYLSHKWPDATDLMYVGQLAQNPARVICQNCVSRRSLHAEDLENPAPWVAAPITVDLKETIVVNDTRTFYFACGQCFECGAVTYGEVRES